MFQTYIKTAYCSLLKNKLSSFINIFGLSLAIDCSPVDDLFKGLQSGIFQFCGCIEARIDHNIFDFSPALFFSFSSFIIELRC